MKRYIKNVEWRRVRLIWIAYNKNRDNDECRLQRLPKDVILVILKFFQTDFSNDNYQRYVNYTELENDNDNELKQESKTSTVADNTNIVDNTDL